MDIDLKKAIRTIPDFPKKNILFRDITTLMQNAHAFQTACDLFYDRYKDLHLDKILGIDARGFIFGSVLAYKLGIGFVPVRKRGKLPFKTIHEKYDLEYGSSEIEIHSDALQRGDRVVIMDDLIATGGTILAATNLAERLEANIVELAFVIELTDLHGRDLLKKFSVFSLVQFDGE